MLEFKLSYLIFKMAFNLYFEIKVEDHITTFSNNCVIVYVILYSTFSSIPTKNVRTNSEAFARNSVF